MTMVSTVNEKQLVSQVTQRYLESPDFNGFPFGCPPSLRSGAYKTVYRLVSDGVISVNFGDRHPNPHIQAFEPESIPVQLEKLRKLQFRQACLYPTRQYLLEVLDQSKYAGRPFSLMIALGAPQLSYLSFDLTVLEFYRNDPRYSYFCDDIGGKISVTNEAWQKDQLRPSDKVILQTFGFSHDADLNRAVAVYLCYLANLTPEHQQIWHAKLLPSIFALHPHYHRLTMGHWDEGGSVFKAVFVEQQLINAMCRAARPPALFSREYSDGPPRGFGFLIRPTLLEFNSFILILDKLLSENINRNFFKKDISLEKEVRRHDGKISVTQKGSLTLLEEWLNKKFPSRKASNPIVVEAFKKIRKLRQRPAHIIEDDAFDQEYLKRQRDLIVDVYKALREVRTMLGQAKSASSCRVPSWISSNKVWIC